MRSISHWTPGYFAARSRELLLHRIKPNDPWLSNASVRLLEQLLRPEDIALEFGSGRSTRWFARRVRHLTSVEHDGQWHAAGLARLKEEGLVNVDLLLRPKDVSETEGRTSAYARVVDQFDNESVDFCLVDGMYRGACAISVVPKLRPGALLVIDNSHWLLPSRSRTFNARGPDAGGYDADWEAFIVVTKGWRRIWTTSGVSDTLLMFKP